ncbi:hypothetical protein [Chryseobacterium sp. JUb7]|uniref:hypothetical protein n=1 Tax=Chryseobacterium sp. JUb7 TaxID=2940599 RepID=UPI0021687AF2|nr:hypothetical protein [Chryseobacterium sp. JUb7]MCS3532181.1 hypothetical protein [Chryseobacterium sp. JUb7]
MKRYIAQYHKKQFVLLSQDNQEIGRIVNNNNFFYFRHYIVFNFRSYDIKNVGFLKNDVELFNGNDVIYFTDLNKERIIKSGEGVRIYQFKLNKTNRLFEKEKLLIEIKEEKKRFEDAIFHVEVEDSVDDLLTLLFLYYSTREFNSIG